MRTNTDDWHPFNLRLTYPLSYIRAYLVVTPTCQYIVEEDALDKFLQEYADTAAHRQNSVNKRVVIYRIDLRLVDYGRLGNVYLRLTGRDLLSDREPAP